jgi:hypothetical protein
MKLIFLKIITECTKIAMPRKFYKNVVAHRLLVFPDDVKMTK